MNDRNMTDEEVPKERPRARIEKMLEELAKKYPRKVDRGFMEQLIDFLGQEQRPGEKKLEYMNRIEREVMELLKKTGGQ